jgi:hypothetical protein
MKKILFLLTILIPGFLYSQDIIIPNVPVPAGCYPAGVFIYHMYNVVKLTGLVQNGKYYIRRDDSFDYSPPLSYLELLYPPYGTYIVGHNFTIIGDGGARGKLYQYTGTSSEESFDYNFEIPNSGLIVGEYTDRPGIRIQKYGSSTSTLKRSIITVVNPAHISGPSFSCSTSVSFTLLDQPFGSNVGWVIKQNGITKAQGTGINAQASNLSNGLANVLYTISFPCNSSSTTVNKDFWIGKPIFNSIIGPSEGFTYNTYTFYANPRGDLLSQSEYTWILNPVNGNSVRPYYDYVDISFYNPYECYQVVGRASNSCGTTEWVMTNICVYNSYSLFPNPASEIVTITDNQIGKAENVNSNITYSIRILDLWGSIQNAFTKSGPSFSIPVNNLKDGNYIIQINDGKKTSNLQLVIKH